ncbi:MAG: hypothetical protein FRX49_01077 [Trebouxia sp. A1-2]|nr:MAG: hypothetical protein FRX49_01077 [Trebouxia sp. A1-2]
MTVPVTIASLYCILFYATLHGIGAQLDWDAMTNQRSLQTGDGTSYGAGQDNEGTCSYGNNMANTDGLPWSSGLTMTVAMNDPQFGASVACGMCITFQGTGTGIGTEPIPGGTEWQTALVTNRCPECLFGSIDQAINGNGRWQVQWFATPCPVGNSKLMYSITVIDQYWFSLVVSNTFVPLQLVEYQINGVWWPAARSVNNQWPYHREIGNFNFPLPIRVTSVAGEVLVDTVPSSSGGWGTQQFTDTGIDPKSQIISNYYDVTGPDGSATLAGATETSTGSTVSASTSTSTASSITTVTASASTSTSPLTNVVTTGVTVTSPVTDSVTILSPSNQIVSSPAAYVAPYTVVNYGQCGGNKVYCDMVHDCVDAVWTGATCNAGFQCNRYDATWWQCQPSSKRLSRRMQLR